MLTVVTGSVCSDDALVDGVAAERDDGVAAHGRIALIVHEQHGEIGVGQVGLDQQRPIHVVMPARLEHQDLAQMVEIVAHVSALFAGWCPWNRRDSRP